MILLLALQLICTTDSLKLPTTALSIDQVKTRAKQLWGLDYVINDRWRGDSRYSIKEVGHMHEYKDSFFGFGPPAIKKTEHILGRDTRGSWRRAWNAAMIEQCKEGGTVIP